MDRNLDDNVVWMGPNDYVSNDNCSYTSCNDQGPITALTALQERTSTWTNLPEMTINKYEYADCWNYGADDCAVTEYHLTQSFAMYARLPKSSEINTIMTNNGGTMPTWLYTNLYSTGDDSAAGYWTSTAYSSDSDEAHCVDYYGIVISYSINDNTFHKDGVRPVIELSK